MDRVILFLSSIVVVASLILTADSEHVYFLGKALPGSCAFDSLFGMRCPGCGLTRSFVHTAHLNWVEAFRLHPIGPIGFLAVAGQIPWRITVARRKVRQTETR